jgi:hypothetical protein
MTSSQPLPARCQWFAWLASALDRRSAPRLALLFLGAVLARGRRTVTTWIRAAKLSDQFRPCDAAVAAAGERADRIAGRVLTDMVWPLVKGTTRLTLALDDTPTRRSGRQVQGAGTPHDPAPDCGPRADDPPAFRRRNRESPVCRPRLFQRRSLPPRDRGRPGRRPAGPTDGGAGIPGPGSDTHEDLSKGPCPLKSP